MYSLLGYVEGQKVIHHRLCDYSFGNSTSRDIMMGKRARRIPVRKFATIRSQGHPLNRERKIQDELSEHHIRLQSHNFCKIRDSKFSTLISLIPGSGVVPWLGCFGIRHTLTLLCFCCFTTVLAQSVESRQDCQTALHSFYRKQPTNCYSQKLPVLRRRILNVCYIVEPVFSIPKKAFNVVVCIIAMVTQSLLAEFYLLELICRSLEPRIQIHLHLRQSFELGIFVERYDRHVVHVSAVVVVIGNENQSDV